MTNIIFIKTEIGHRIEATTENGYVYHIHIEDDRDKIKINIPYGQKIIIEPIAQTAVDIFTTL